MTKHQFILLNTLQPLWKGKTALVYKSFRAVIFKMWTPEQRKEPTQFKLLAIALFFHSHFLLTSGEKPLYKTALAKHSSSLNSLCLFKRWICHSRWIQKIIWKIDLHMVCLNWALEPLTLKSLHITQEKLQRQDQWISFCEEFTKILL